MTKFEFEYTKIGLMYSNIEIDDGESGKLLF